MKWEGPDSLKSWLISLACCFINATTFGMSRLSGVLFVASITRFNVGRQKASFPYTLAVFLRNVTGPLVGYFGHKYGVRNVTAFGALLGAVGAGLSYFAEDILIVTIFWGVIFGIGFSFSNVLLPISINQYFEKHRATASGISFSGACFGSFILPPIVEFLLTNYGLSQTFLFLSGIILNCVPVALLLRKPKCMTKNKYQEYTCKKLGFGRQSSISRSTGSIHTIEKRNKPEIVNHRNSAIDRDSMIEENSNRNYTDLTYEERMKRISTQTLLSDYSVRMSSSEPLDAVKIIENSKGRRQVNVTVLEGETFSLSSDNTEQVGTSEKDEVFDKAVSPAPVEYKNTFHPIEFSRSVSKDDCRHSTASDNLEILETNAYQNYAYKYDTDGIRKLGKSSDNIHTTDCAENCVLEQQNIQYSNFHCAHQGPSHEIICTTENFKNSSYNYKEHVKEPEWLDIKSENRVYQKSELAKNKKKSTLGSFSVILDPIFILICVTNAIYGSSFVCMFTIIVDFSRDLHIDTSKEKYILMLLSIGDVAGRLGLGWITDRGYMSKFKFAALSFISQGVLTVAIVWSNDFVSLAILVTLYGFSQSGLIIIYPLLIAEYVEQDKQTVAIPSSHFLAGPMCLAISPLIGYFRDEIGAYDWILYGITLLLVVCSILCMLAPAIDKCRKRS